MRKKYWIIGILLLVLLGVGVWLICDSLVGRESGKQSGMHNEQGNEIDNEEELESGETPIILPSDPPEGVERQDTTVGSGSGNSQESGKGNKKPATEDVDPNESEKADDNIIEMPFVPFQ